ESVSKRLEAEAARDIRLVVCDLSASPHIDLAGARMLRQLQFDLARRGITLRIAGAHGRVRDLLRAEGVGEKVGGPDRRCRLDELLGGAGRWGHRFAKRLSDLLGRRIDVATRSGATRSSVHPAEVR